jgi:hypothetical protein
MPWDRFGKLGMDHPETPEARPEPPLGSPHSTELTLDGGGNPQFVSRDATPHFDDRTRRLVHLGIAAILAIPTRAAVRSVDPTDGCDCPTCERLRRAPAHPSDRRPRRGARRRPSPRARARAPEPDVRPDWYVVLTEGLEELATFAHFDDATRYLRCSGKDRNFVSDSLGRLLAMRLPALMVGHARVLEAAGRWRELMAEGRRSA